MKFFPTCQHDLDSQYLKKYYIVFFASNYCLKLSANHFYHSLDYIIKEYQHLIKYYENININTSHYIYVEYINIWMQSTRA